MAKTGVTPSAQQVLDLLKQGRKSQRKIKEALGMSDGDYNDAKQELLAKGLVERYACFGGGLALSEPETTGKEAEPGKPGPEEQVTITPKQRSKLSEILFNAIPKDGSLVTNHAVLQKVQEEAKSRLGLEVSKETYFEIRKELIAEGRVGKGVGFGGRVYRIEGAALAAKAAKQHRIPESKLYEAVGKYIGQTWTEDNEIQQFVLDKTASGRGKRAGGKWTRPDFAIVAIHKFMYVPGTTIELVTFEVKPADDFRIEGVFETAAHSRAAHRSYLVIHTPDGKPKIDKFERLVDECERFDLGLIIFETPR